MTEEADDKTLIAWFRAEGTKQKAFGLILRKYQKKTYWHVRRIVINHDDADDVVQNTFIKVWENLAGFREASQLYTWIFRIATNEALQFLQKKKSAITSSINELEYELGQSLTASSYFNGNKIELKLQQAILNLPE